MKDLTLVPLGGLCNRLRALVSARSLLSYDPALRIQVVWAAKAECAARFDELFEDNLTLAGRFAFRSAGFLDAPAVLRRNLRLPALLRRLRYDGQYADFHSAAAPAECLVHFRAAQRVYISTGSPLCSTPAAEWGVLSPLPALRRRIASLVNSFGKNTIGVHIRRTDNEKSWHVSPLSAFVREMQAALAEDPEVTFYLATDDEGGARALVRLVPRSHPHPSRSLNPKYARRYGGSSGRPLCTLENLPSDRLILEFVHRHSGRIGQPPAHHRAWVPRCERTLTAVKGKRTDTKKTPVRNSLRTGDFVSLLEILQIDSVG